MAAWQPGPLSRAPAHAQSPQEETLTHGGAVRSRSRGGCGGRAQGKKADRAEKADIGELDDQIDMAGAGRQRDDVDAQHRARDAARDQHPPRREVEALALHLRRRAGERRGDDLPGEAIQAGGMR